MGGDQAHQFNYFSAKTGIHASHGLMGMGANSNSYDEEDVEQLEREIENVMKRSNLANSSALYLNASAYDDQGTVNMTVNDSFAAGAANQGDANQQK